MAWDADIINDKVNNQYNNKKGYNKSMIYEKGGSPSLNHFQTNFKYRKP